MPATVSVQVKTASLNPLAFTVIRGRQLPLKDAAQPASLQREQLLVLQ